MSNDINSTLNQIAMQNIQDNGRVGAGTIAGQNGRVPSWLQAMVEGMSRMLDDVSKDMISAANNVSKDDPSTLVRFQVLSQQFSLVMNTVTTAVKTIGEAQTTAARKQ